MSTSGAALTGAGQVPPPTPKPPPPVLSTTGEISIRVVSAILICLVVGAALWAYMRSVAGICLPGGPDHDTTQQALKVLGDKTASGDAKKLATLAIDGLMNANASCSTTVAGLFGALTTLIGTGLSAYFGISAASGTARTLTTSVNAAGQTNSALQGKNDVLSSQIDAIARSANNAMSHANAAGVVPDHALQDHLRFTRDLLR
jgi:hypothetical protein